jgi:uncharacterized membrane protein
MHPIHPMIVHFPIALLTTGWCFDALARWRRHERLREASLYLLITGVLAAALAILTGHWAEEAAERSGIPEQALEIHEQLGFAAFWLFTVVLGLRLASRRSWMPDKPVLVLAIGAVALLVLLGASYFGGDLVYRFGAGVAAR